MSATRLLLAAIVKAGSGPLPRKEFDVSCLSRDAINWGIEKLLARGAIVKVSARRGRTPGLFEVTAVGRALQAGELVVKPQHKIKGQRSPHLLVPANSDAARNKPKLSGWGRLAAAKARRTAELESMV